MSKKKFILIVVIDIILVAVIVIFGFRFYETQKYSIENLDEMMSTANIASNNIYLKTDFFYEDEDDISVENENFTRYMEVYKKDGKNYTVYTNSKNEKTMEIFYNSETQKDIIVNHIDKTVTGITLESEESGNQFNYYEDTFKFAMELNELYEHRGQYKYHGKEIIDGKKYLKISITDYYKEQVDRMYYYIDLETNFVIKRESWAGETEKDLAKISSMHHTYKYNEVKDEDILEFNIENYLDYQTFVEI